jgi:hypothetical protein
MGRHLVQLQEPVQPEDSRIGAPRFDQREGRDGHGMAVFDELLADLLEGEPERTSARPEQISDGARWTSWCASHG